MNNPFDYIPDNACDSAFGELIDRIERDGELRSYLETGKMLGVLIAEDSDGNRHTLYAFSGQLGDKGFSYPGFVEPVFDYLQPDGYFKTHERAISALNAEISEFENGHLSKVSNDYQRAEQDAETCLSEYKEFCRMSKLERDALRAAGKAEESDMMRRSQFEKAELRRLKKRLAAELEPIETKLKEIQFIIGSLKDRRRSDSEALQNWLFDNFKLLNARGESRSLNEIFALTSMKVPPSGAGECCAPKLLQAAYLRGWKPLSIAEYWFGRPKEGEVRRHGSHYPACRGKCLPVLGWMLQGLDIYPPLDSESQALVAFKPEIIFENQWFCVVNKPAGMLSVPGKGAALSLEEWLSERYGPERVVKMAHRLDRDTSGLVVATFGDESFKIMQNLFATRRVRKTYVADLEGQPLGESAAGSIDLPLAPCYLDRPRQRVDLADGKPALTEYEISGSRAVFRPLTGRTHQLRVHAASDRGLGRPIVGDRLYGNPADRLHLHAHKLEFTFPLDGRNYSFVSPVPF